MFCRVVRKYFLIRSISDSDKRFSIGLIKPIVHYLHLAFLAVYVVPASEELDPVILDKFAASCWSCEIICLDMELLEPVPSWLSWEAALPEPTEETASDEPDIPKNRN